MGTHGGTRGRPDPHARIRRAGGGLLNGPGPDGSAVRAVGLRKAYGDTHAVAGIDFTIGHGECVGFLGPNGAGKTTTMRMMSCLSPRDGGELTVLGEDPSPDARALKRRLGVVAQETNLDVELTVRENLLVYARYFDLTGDEARKRVGELLDLMELGGRADDGVETLSGGMMRRLQIARALINTPGLILFDEPTTGLDPRARHLVWDRLRALRADGVTTIITTHYMDEAAQLCDRLYLMDEGRITLQGPPDELVATTVGAWALELENDTELERLGPLARAGGRQAGRFVVFTDQREECRGRLAAEGTTVVAERPATLEDVFLVETGRSLSGDGSDREAP